VRQCKKDSQPASGTFGFAPKHKADPSAKPKEPLFSPRTDNNLYFANRYFDK